MKRYHIQHKPYIKLRIIATLIDYGIYFFLLFVYIAFIGHETEEGAIMVEGMAALPLFLVWFLYFVLLEGINQATPGHDIVKLKVIKTSGEKIGLGNAFKRRIIDVIDLGMYGLPAIICINKTTKHQRIGDLFADTLVVKQSDITEEEIIF